MAFSLPRLPIGNITPEQMQIWWQQVVEAIEAQENAQNDLIDDLTTTQENLATAQTALADTETRLKIGLSWTVPATVLTAADAGTDATVNVLAHTRVYGDATDVGPLPTHSFTGLAYSTSYGVYYDDPTCASLTPVYEIDDNPVHAQNNFVSGRHRVGVITTPAAGEADTSGGTAPPGGGGDKRDLYSDL